MAVKYTVETVTVPFTGFSLITDYFPVTLIITPNEGYVVEAADFSVGAISDDSGQIFPVVDSISQGGDQVFVVINTIAPGTMPFSDIELSVDIDGDAKLPPVTLAGEINYNNISNITPLAVASTYSISGQPGEIAEVWNGIITADANYTLTNAYSAVASLANEYTENYSVEITETITSGEVTSINVTVSYEFPSESVSGDEIIISANAVEIFTPSIVYTSYAGADTLLAYTGSEWGAKVFGADGAQVVLTLHDTTNNTAISTTNYIIGQRGTSGQIKATVPIPDVVADTDYTMTFSGDIDPGFTQTNPLVVEQRDLNRQATFTITNVPGYIVAIVGSPSITGIQGDIGQSTSSVSITVESMTLDNLVGVSQTPTVVGQFSNIDPNSNGGTTVSQTSATLVQGANTTDMIITYYLGATFGSSDIVCDIDLTAILTDTTP